MNFDVVFDWKSFVALGLTAVGIILTSKMDSATAERVTTVVADAVKECVFAVSDNSDC